MKLWSRVRAVAHDIYEHPDDWLYDLTAAVVTLLAVCIVVLNLVAMAGCASPVREINRQAEIVRAAADTGKGELQAARDTGDVGPKAAPHVDAADGQFDVVKVSAATVQKQLPGVQDKVSPWAGILKLWGFIIAAALVIFSSIYWGWGALVKPLFQAAGHLIPVKTMTEAKLHAEAIVDGSIGKLKEAVASRRTHDRVYDAAFKVSKTKAESEKP